MEKLRKNQGITLIALIITIIILIILAGVSIAKLTGQGLFGRADEAKLKTKRAQISEWLNLKLMEEQSKNIQGTQEDIIKATCQNVTENKNELYKMGKNVEIKKVSNEENGKTVDVYFYVVVDGDIYKVCLKGVKFIGESENLPPTIEPGDIIFTLEPSGWTNESVTVTAEVKEGIDITGFTLQTSKDGTNYTSTASQTFTANGTIYARVVDSTEQYKAIATRDIENIDKTKPEITYNFSAYKSSTDPSTAILTDFGASDSESKLSKFIIYYKKSTESIYLQNVNESVLGQESAIRGGKITDLTPGTTYNLYAEAYDLAGNVVTSSVISVKTDSLIASDISYTPSDSNWKVDNVKAALDSLYSR